MSKIVVIRAGVSESILWEIKEAISIDVKKVILIAPLGKKNYNKFKNSVEKIGVIKEASSLPKISSNDTK